MQFKKSSCLKFNVLLLLLSFSHISSVVAKEFLIFDLITAIDKPNDLPLTPMHMIYQWHAYGGTYTSDEDKDYVNSIPDKYVRCCYTDHYLKDNPPEYFSIDFEQWSLYNLPEKEVQKNLEYHKITFELFRDTLPENARIAWYNTGALPIGRLFNASATDKAYIKWQKRNDELKGIVSEYDFMQPSLYYSTKHNMPNWKKTAKAFISEHKRLGRDKPVYAHLSPQYIDDPTQPLPGAIWKEMLEFSYQNADGVIIWTFPQKRYQLRWQDHSGWWQETLELLERVNKKD